MPRKAKEAVVVEATAKKTVKTAKTAKVVKAKKTFADRINATVAKAPEGLSQVKLATADFLSLLATILEKGEGVNYTASCGVLSVLPKKPKELANTVKYLRRIAATPATK